MMHGTAYSIRYGTCFRALGWEIRIILFLFFIQHQKAKHDGAGLPPTYTLNGAGAMPSMVLSKNS